MDTRSLLAHEVHEELSIAVPSAVRLIDALVRHAYSIRSSDIHINPIDTKILVRMRVDGILYDSFEFPKTVQNELLARLKILSGLRTDEHAQPQDGKFAFETAKDSPDTEVIDVRVSIAPTYYGENAVLRLLAPQSNLQSLESLGFSTGHRAQIMKAIKKPNGLILITGSTGSGKTSTLYTLIQYLNKRATSIITIEDPVEYSVAGITQLQAERVGFTFAEGLRSILRQDPNIIGVGEIRDAETASMATHAALTGHLVLSTLHTVDAPSTISRLIAMGTPPYLIASTLTLVIHQRLIPMLCIKCRKRVPVRKDHQEIFQKIFPTEHFQPKSYFVAAGCDECGGTGKSGRVGVFEVLPISKSLKQVITSNSVVHELPNALRSQGFESAWNDGLKKALAGTISLDDALSLFNE